jgi:hypothetical protein
MTSEKKNRNLSTIACGAQMEEKNVEWKFLSFTVRLIELSDLLNAMCRFYFVKQ